MKPGYLILETGEIFKGKIIGNKNVPVFGEVVFNTSMTGYQEIMTDPSYAGQIVVFTYPLVGNYGIDEKFSESLQVHANAIVVKELEMESNPLDKTNSLLSMIEKFNLPCLIDVDTRQLVRSIREKGTVQGIISDRLTTPLYFQKNVNLLNKVTTKSVTTYEKKGPHILLLDFGYKKSILDYLLDVKKCKVTVVPYFYPIEKIHELKPDGVVISNGPGNPMTARDQFEKIRQITEVYPTLGICLGHQLIALAYGLKTKKLLFGHRGGNHPVKDLETDKVYITSQNHGYVVEDFSINESEFEIAFINVNDGTIEGLRHKRKPIITVQFHPEGHPGPLDTEFVFDHFLQSLIY